MATLENLIFRVKTNLDETIQDPQTRLNAKLLDQLSDSQLSIPEPSKRQIVNRVSALLQGIQQDPEPATRLADSLVSTFSFADVQAIEPPVDLAGGLKAPSPPVQLLSLRLIGLAARQTSDIAIIAGNLELTRALVDTWLRTTDIAVASRAGKVIISLLLADTAPEPLLGLMQRRLFKDKDIYELFYALTSLTNIVQEDQPSLKQKTIAQGRLFGFLLDVWHLEEVWQSQNPDIEQRFGLKPDQGLMHFSSLHMIDKDDILLRRTQIDFFAHLLKGTERSSWSNRKRNSTHELPEREVATNKIVRFLQDNGIHSKLLSLYANPNLHDPIDASFLHGPAAKYVCEYLLNSREHFTSDETTRKSIFNRLLKSIGDTQTSQWARNNGPSDDLDVLISLPFPVLAYDPSCLLILPTRPPSADVFRCLERLFSGLSPMRRAPTITNFPSDQDNASESLTSKEEEDARADTWASRLLYIRYITAQPRFWPNLVAASSAVALKDTAIAAINLMTAIIQARWREETPAGLEVPVAMQSMSGDSEAPATGLAAVLHPSALDHVVPFLMKGPAEGRNAGLLGSDTSAAEYRVAEAKLRMTQALKQGIEELVQGLKSEDEKDKALLTELAAGLGVLLRQGARRDANEPGAEVGTMEL